MPAQAKARGSLSHTDPDCRCNYCISRRRKAEALSIAVRDGRDALASGKAPSGIIENLAMADNNESIEVPLDWHRPHAEGPVVRVRLAQWLALRSENPDITNAECARRMGIHRATLNTIIQKSVKQGLLKFSDPLERIDHEIVPKVLDNISEFLSQKNPMVTMETAKGTIFKAYQEAKGISEAPKTILALKIEAIPHSDLTAKPVGGNVFGNPRSVIDAISVGEAEALPLGKAPNSSEEVD